MDQLEIVGLDAACVGNAQVRHALQPLTADDGCAWQWNRECVCEDRGVAGLEN